MKNVLYSENYQGYEINIKQDPDPQSCLEWDSLGTIATWHRRYNLGHEQPKESPAEFISMLYKNKAIFLPVYMYDHSGITISTSPFSCNWDSGQLGIIYVTREKLDDPDFYHFKPKKRIKVAKVKEYLEQEIKTYDQYLTGQVYGFVIKKDGETIDSCWGFYEDNIETSYCLEEARNLVDCEIKRNRKEHFEQVKTWIRNKVPLQNRKAL